MNLDATGLPIFLKEKNTELLKRKVFTKWVMDQVLNWESTRALDISEDTIFLRTIPTHVVGGWNIYNTPYIGKESRRTLTFPSAGVNFSWSQSYSRSDSRIKNLAKLSKNTRIIPQYVKKKETIFLITYRVEFTPRKTTLSFFVRPGSIFRAGGSSKTFREESRGKIEENTLYEMASKLRSKVRHFLVYDPYFWQSLPRLRVTTPQIWCRRGAASLYRVTVCCVPNHSTGINIRAKPIISPHPRPVRKLPVFAW